jgi:hypothetical protein
MSTTTERPSATSVKQVHHKARKDKDRVAESNRDLRAVLGMPEGRRVLWGQLTKLDEISAHQSGSWTYFAEGERNAALKLKAAIIRANPEAWLQMQREAQQRALSDDAEDEAVRTVSSADKAEGTATSDAQ